jgi:hypothetical protein
MSKTKEIKVILPQEGTFTRGRLTKLTDDKFNGKHPNKINEGFTHEGIIWQNPIEGQSCAVGGMVTSVVTEVLEQREKEIRFRTMNSTYKLEIL